MAQRQVIGCCVVERDSARLLAFLHRRKRCANRVVDIEGTGYGGTTESSAAAGKQDDLGIGGTEGRAKEVAVDRFNLHANGVEHGLQFMHWVQAY